MNNKYIKTDVEGLVKDSHSGAVLNVDNEKLEAYKRQKAILEIGRTMPDKYLKLERDVQHIKMMLEQVLSSIQKANQ